MSQADDQQIRALIDAWSTVFRRGNDASDASCATPIFSSLPGDLSLT